MGKGSEKRRRPACSEEEDALHILLKCSEIRKWGEQSLSIKCFIVNEEVSYNYTNAVDLRNIVKYSYQIRSASKWENKIRNV
jgi:hypothetical protein